MFLAGELLTEISYAVSRNAAVGSVEGARCEPVWSHYRFGQDLCGCSWYTLTFTSKFFTTYPHGVWLVSPVRCYVDTNMVNF